MKSCFLTFLLFTFCFFSFAQEKEITDTMPPVEVKSVRSTARNPFSFIQLNKKSLDKLNTGVDLPFVLQQTPSLIASSDAGNGIGYTNWRIRGTDASRINLTINGIPFNDPESQGTFLVNIPDLVSSSQSIQVQRGVGSSTNGTGAFGGSIHIQTNSNDSSEYFTWLSGFGSFNSWRNTMIYQSGLMKNNWIIQVRGSLIGSDGYVDRARTDLISGMASVRKLFKNRDFRFNIITGKEKTYAAWFGINRETLDTNRRFNPAGTDQPGTPYENETDNYRQTHYQFFWNEHTRKHWTLGSTLFLTTGKGYFEQYKSNQNWANYGLNPIVIGTDTTRSSDLIRQLWLDNKFYGIQFNAQYQKNQYRLNIGSTLNRYDGKHFGDVIQTKSPNTTPNFRWYNLDAHKTEAATFIKAEKSYPSGWNIFGDAQIRYVNYIIHGFRNNPTIVSDNKYLFFNPKVGISYLQNQWKYYASYARGAKEPNRDDFEASTKDQPRAEKLNDFELGLSYQTPSFGLDINGYYMIYKDQLVLNGRVNDVFAYARTNIPQSFRRGIEISARVNITPTLIFQSNVTFSQNKALDYTEFIDDYDAGIQQAYFYSTTNLAFSPSAMANGSLEWNINKSLTVSWMSRYVGHQYLDNTNDPFKRLDPFFINDFRLDATFMNRKKIKWTGYVLINNIFSEEYEPNGYTYSYISAGNLFRDRFYYPMATIHGMIGMKFNWNRR